MTYSQLGRRGPDYYPCHYGRSKVTFRGPKIDTAGRYAVFLGGNETYGRFLPQPFPALVAAATGLDAINLGCTNAGLDVYAKDPSLLEIVAGAEVAVIQIVGAHNVSNRYYAVHPRRNDRFLRASNTLKAIYHEVDFCEFHFTRHLLTALRDCSPERFSLVREELRTAWVARMRSLIAQVAGKAVLLWLSDRTPDDPDDDLSPGSEPVFVDRAMLDALGDTGAQLVEVVAEPAEIASGREAMLFSPLERVVANEMLGPRVHARVAAALTPCIMDADGPQHRQRPA